MKHAESSSAEETVGEDMMRSYRWVVPLFSLFLLDVRIAADEAEDRAVALIKKLDGSFERDKRKAEKPVIRVNLEFSKACDADLKILSGLKHLQALNLDGTTVTGAGLKELASLKGLQDLHLHSTKVGDADLKELATLKGLQFLNLTATKITDAGLKELAALKRLEVLNLTGTKVTKVAVQQLQKALPKTRIVQ